MTTVTRTEQIQFKSNVIGSLCHASKNLFNFANYLVRQRVFENDKLYKETGEKSKGIFYKDMYALVKNEAVYKSFPAACAQQTLKLLEKSWKSYFKAIAIYIKSHDKFLGRPQLPHYKPKNGEHILIFTNQQCKIVDGILKFPKAACIELKTRLKDVDLREVRIIPKGTHYVCEIIYNKEISLSPINSTRVIGIDLGINNIATIANNFGAKPIVVKGGVIKSINQFYNKEKARIQSVYDISKLKYGNKLRKLDHKRNDKVKDYFHKLSRVIVNYALASNIKTIIIGKNDGWKQEVNLGKRNNQNFTQLPLAKLIEMIQYKADEHGIEIILQEEAHTSKCSFLDNEPVEHRDIYAGRRITRGIFKSAKGIYINADVNGALNIIRKAIPKAFADEIVDVELHPKRYYI